MVKPLTASAGLAKRQARHGGFTLLELLVVLAIIGVLAVLSIPAIKGLTESAATSTATRHLASTMALARSTAVAKRTVVRFGIVTNWEGDPEAAYRKYALWEWDRESEGFLQSQEWESLRPGLVFEPSRPDYLNVSRYAQRDGSAVRGDFVPSPDFETFVSDSAGREVELAYFEFTPSGGARVEGGELRSVLFSIVPGIVDGESVTYTGADGGVPTDWVQFNIDTLTGRARVYRP